MKVSIPRKNNESIEKQEFVNEHDQLHEIIEESPSKSQNASNILVEESIEELRNRSEIYDANISIGNVVLEIAEIILADATFEAINTILSISENYHPVQREDSRDMISIDSPECEGGNYLL